MQKRQFLPLIFPVLLLLIVSACWGGDSDAITEESTKTSRTESIEQLEDSPVQDTTLPLQSSEPEQTEEIESPTDDPDREVLVYGESFSASLELVDGFRQFRFEGEEGDLVKIVIDGKDGMDPMVSLQEPNRTEIANNDDLSATNRDSVVITTLPTNGLQVVRVRAFEGAIGRFTIKIEKLLQDDDDESGLISIGDSVDGVLGVPDDFDVFEFSGEIGEAITLNVDGAVGVDVLTQIFDPDGLFIFSDDDSGHGLDAEINLFLEKTGTYKVEVAAVSGKIGSYVLSVDPQKEWLVSESAEQMKAVALTYLNALQEGDALTIFALAGPEALSIWGWESPGDVDRDIQKLQSIGVTGIPGETLSTANGVRGRTTVDFDMPGIATPEQLRFDLISVNGVWLVDFAQRLFNPN